MVLPIALSRFAERIDARIPQLLVVGGFVSYAVLALGAPIRLPIALAFFAGTLFAEALAAHWRGASFDPRSPAITAMSLTLLLRCADPLLAFAIGAVAITSKYLIRIGDKQVFNPSNIVIVAATLLDFGWVTTGTWGHAAMQVALVAGLGTLITWRATRLDLAVSFLLGWWSLILLRALYLGDPLEIALHHCLDGTLPIFAFFMITDPRATPDHRAGRLLFAAALVLLAGWLRFVAWQPDGLLWALAIVSPLTPLLDRLFRARRFVWSSPLASEVRS